MILDITSLHLKPPGKEHNVINQSFHFSTFLLLPFLWPPLVSRRPLSHVYQWTFSTSKVDIMNTPHQCRDSFFTLLATKPPVRTAVDVTPIIDLARRSWSSQLAEFLMPLPLSLHAAEMPPACRAEESPAPPKPTHNRLSTLVMPSPLPLQLFVFRSSWISLFWRHFFMLAHMHRTQRALTSLHAHAKKPMHKM